jgi:hypothetical protein
MKPRKNLILAIVLGLTLVASATGMAQTPAQGDQKEKTHACCSLDTCSCKDGSCPMKNDGTANGEAKECSCCTGDSCEMKAKDDTAKDGTKKESCCNMKHKHTKEKAKPKAA